MPKLNSYFYRLYLPTQLITLGMIITWAYGSVQVNYWLLFLSWFLIGPIGTGVGLHRLFSHRQFETYRPIEVALAWLGTLSAYGPILYWASAHQYHHKHADTDLDLNSPKRGFWHSYLYWRLTEASTKKIDLKNKCVIRAARDPAIVFLSKNFISINWTVIVLLALVDVNLLLSLYILPVFIEQQRMNILNSLAHMKLPGSYKIENTSDNSYNNAVLGILTLGFGWHNAHHSKPWELVNTHHWWELDIEGLIGKFISKKN